MKRSHCHEVLYITLFDTTLWNAPESFGLCFSFSLIAATGGINSSQAALLAGNPLFANAAAAAGAPVNHGSQMDIQSLLGGGGAANQLTNPLLVSALTGGGGASAGALAASSDASNALALNVLGGQQPRGSLIDNSSM